MMGSGKSYWAHQISSILNIPVLDTDQLIVAEHNQTIVSIFEKEGDDQFRLYEKKLLDEYPWPDEAVIATGGGLPCFHGNMKTLLQLGNVVFLDPPLEILIERLWNEINERPMVAACSNKKELQIRIGELLEQRRPFYEQATIILKMPNVELAEWEYLLKG